MAALRLRIEPSEWGGSQRVVFGAGLRNRHRYEETLTRLRKIVGDRVGSPRHLDTHRGGVFERAPLLSEIDEATPATAVAAGPPVSGPTLRRYPLGFRTSVQVRDGKPLRLESVRVSGVVIASFGPWKSEGDWWHRERGWERIEWDVELLNHGLFRLVETGQGWVLEGYYD